MHGTRGTPAARLIVAAAALLGSGAMPARAVGQSTDSLTTWLDWGTVAFLIRADTAHGIQLWANALVARKDGAEPRTFVARYDPATVATWAMDAELLLLPDQAGPNDPPEVLAVAPLVDLHGARFIAARRREGRRWARKVVLAFDSDGDEPLAFAVERSQATRLFSALAAAAGPSRLRDRTYATQLDDCGNGDRVSVAPAHVATPVLRYPEALADRGMPGLAVVSFIVDTTGRALMDGGFRVIFSTHPAFTQAARDAVATSRFRPALRGGVPVRAPVCQSILFMITTNPRDANR
jgi:hypothetical protein